MTYRALLLTGAVITTVTMNSALAAMTPPSVQQTVSPSTQGAISIAAPIARLETSISDRPATPSDSNPALSNVPDPKINLVDQPTQSPEFAQFIQQVRQAVQNRDAKFIRSIVTAKTNFGFGEHRSINYLNPDSPESPFWSELETTIATECQNTINSASQMSPKGVVFDCSIGSQPRTQSVTARARRAIFADANGRWMLQTFVPTD